MAGARESRSLLAMPASAFTSTSPVTSGSQRLARRARVWISGSVAAGLGLAPHVLHHAGPLAGAALVGGVTGSLLFGAIGFLLAVPFLLRLRRRCGGWRVPGTMLAIMVVVFAISTFVVGPAISGGGDGDGGSPTAPANGSGHLGHH